ncbi:glycosyltransferase [bacterium]|nr:MAG: glycosyltransferase [bacterium]
MIQLISNLYPRVGFPSSGIFVKDHAEILNQILPTEIVVLKTIFPRINTNWKLYGALPIISDLRTQTLPFFTFPKFKTPYLSSIQLTKYYKKAFSNSQINLAILHFLYPSVLLTPHLIKNKTPFVLHIHGSDVDIIVSNKKLRTLTQEAVKKTQWVFYSGLESIERLKKVVSIPDSKCKYIPNPIFIHNAQVSQQKHKHDLKFEKNIATVANIVEYKGVQTILALAKENPRIGFHIIGRVTSDSFAIDFIHKANQQENLIIHDPMERPALHTFLSKMDTYLHPSIKEAFGMAVCESILLGLPILARKVGVLNDFDESEQLHFFDDSISVSQLASCVNSKKHINSETIKKVKMEYSREAIQAVYLNLINGL